MDTEQTGVQDPVHLVQTEYLEMPGLRLTKAQLRRLCGLEEQTCDVVLNQLLSTHFLKRTSRDVYALDASAY
jgi:hypothetical protein